MSSSRSRKNRSSTSPDPASAPARSPLSLSKSRDGGPATSDSDDDGHHPRRHSRIDANEPRQGPSAPTAQRKADNDDVAAVALPFSLSLTLKNTGSVARDHLASERTFLAYVRTSLSFASAGVALVQLFRVSVSTSSSGGGIAVGSYARPLGATTIAFGIAVLATGTFRYFAVQRALPQGLFPAARVSVFLQAITLAVLVGIVFGILVAAH